MQNTLNSSTEIAHKRIRKLKRFSLLSLANGIFILIIVFALQNSSWVPALFAHPNGTTKIARGAAANVASLPDGQGVYESCRLDTMDQQCLDRLTQIAAGGFKLVLNYDSLLANATQLVGYLNQASSLHIRVILALNNPVWWNNSQSAISTYTALASSCANDPSYAPCSDDTTFLHYILQLVSTNSGLWGYYIGDEVRPGDFAQLKIFTDKIVAVDNTHPRLFVASTLSGVATVNTDLVRLTTEPGFPSANSATVIAQNYYPIGSWPQLSLDGPTTIGPQLSAVQKNNATHNGVVMDYAMVLQAHSFLPYVPQGYGCGNPASLTICPYPTIPQMQTMLNDLLQNAHPRLVLWYSFFDLLRSGNPDYHWANTITSAGFNAIQNPSFEPWSAPWVWRNSGPGSNATGTAQQECVRVASPQDAFCSAHVQVTAGDPNHDWYVSFHQSGISITSGKPTYISFDARSANGGTLYFVLNNDTTYSKYFVQTPVLTSNWTHYSYTFNNTQFTDSNALFTLIFGDHTGDVWVNSVVITTPS